MSDEFGQLLSEQKEVAISQGAVVSGQVIAVKEDEIVLNIGYKADAVISRNEFTNIPNANLCDLVKVGDEIEAKVLEPGIIVKFTILPSSLNTLNVLLGFNSPGTSGDSDT